jgi:glutamate/tyrosine decarboxylase-like PLP-dependent enzyme
MVDPLAQSAAIAKRHRLWLHVDAAWGGALAASPRLAHHLSGIELADSITVDAHKWFATTMGAGMFLVPQQSILNRVFQVTTSYMPASNPSDPYASSMQWSRRFLGLRLFLSLAHGGWDAYANHVERAVSLAADLGRRLQQMGWQVLNDSSMAVLCMIPPNGSRPVADIVATVVSSGAAWVSTAQFAGTAVVRACITHGQTTAADIDALADALVRAAVG